MSNNKHLLLEYISRSEKRKQKYKIKQINNYIYFIQNIIVIPTNYFYSVVVLDFLPDLLV